jgi:hypothetical protein
MQISRTKKFDLRSDMNHMMLFESPTAVLEKPTRVHDQLANDCTALAIISPADPPSPSSKISEQEPDLLSDCVSATSSVESSPVLDLSNNAFIPVPNLNVQENDLSLENQHALMRMILLADIYGTFGFASPCLFVIPFIKHAHLF